MLKKMAAIVLIALIFQGAWAAGENRDMPVQAGQTLLIQTPDKGYGMVYVVREFEPRPHYQFHVYLDGAMGKNRIGYTLGGQYIYFQVLPGEHELISVGLNTKTIPFDIEAGNVIFIQQNVQMDSRTGSNQAPLEILSPQVGRYRVEHGVEGWMDRK